MAQRPAHYRGTYDRKSRQVVAIARADPRTCCWRCGRTLDQHPPHRNGKPARWTAGHVIDGQVDGLLQPEASTCNYGAGAMLAHGRTPGTPSRAW